MLLNDPEFPSLVEGKKYAVLVFMHGSGGIGWLNTMYLIDYAARLNAIVIAPDSFARPARGAHDLPLYFQARQRELKFALAKLKQALWADQNNLFLLGQSEGGMAVAAFDQPGFRAAAITGFHCRHIQNSIDLPHSTAVISAQNPFDPTWMTGPFSRGRGGPGTCAPEIQKRSNSEMVEFTDVHPSAHDGNRVLWVRGRIIGFFRKYQRAN